MSDIVVGFDDTAGADDALAFAAQVARATGASLRLVWAYPSAGPRARVSDGASGDYAQDDAGAVLATAAASVDDVDVTVEPITGVAAAHALHAAVERCDATLVVVGSTHRGPVGRVLPGSTGERLLHGAPCAVAIAPRRYAKRPGGITTVGVGYDASDEASHALAAACLLSRRLGAALRVFHVFDATRVGRPALMTGPAWSTMRDEHEGKQREELEQAVATWPRDVPAESRFLIGRPGDELARQSEAVDVMLVGSRGHGPLAALLLGGVSHVLLARAACPVVVVPRGVTSGLDSLFAPAVAA
jgi:nucleotide-binding universal stress UspA family protein